MVIDWERRTQLVRFVHNVGAIEVPEGLEQLSDEDWYEAVVAIHVNTQRLARQIDKLIEEAKAEVQARSLYPERVELVELLRATAKGFDLVSDRWSWRRKAPPWCSAGP